MPLCLGGWLGLWLNAPMQLPLPLAIGLRYTRARKGESFVSFISAVSMVGLVLGVAVLIVVLSVMNGFDKELRTRILGMVPHGVLYSDVPLQDWSNRLPALRQTPGVAGVAPWTEGQGMLTQGGQVNPLVYYGIDPVLEPDVSILPEHMQAGELANLAPGEFGIVMGSLLARRMGLDLGDPVTLLIPEANLTVAGVRPRLKRLTLVGIFEVGAELDGTLAYLHWEDAAKLKRQKGSVDGIRVKFDDLFTAPAQLRQLAGDEFRARDWTRTHGNLFQAIALEKTMIGLLLTMIVAVAAFNIVATLVMTVNAKRPDIAVLRVMGMGPGQVLATFIVQGVSIGLVGVLGGSILGLAVAFNVPAILDFIEQTFGFVLFSADAYFISYLPSEPRASDVITIVVGSFGLCLLSTLYPAWRAARTQPAEVLASGH